MGQRNDWNALAEDEQWLKKAVQGFEGDLRQGCRTAQNKARNCSTKDFAKRDKAVPTQQICIVSDGQSNGAMPRQDKWRKGNDAQDRLPLADTSEEEQE